ncbi:MAG: hypothetical protein Q4F65_05685 [Propionibacteriaceae bacterium]|nr:hypothetical protein [Propionibacteriaceae bacterium]
MSEQDTTTPKEVTETGATPADVADKLGEGGKRALTAEREARKAAEDAAKALQAELDQIKQAQMSDLEKAQAQARSYEKAATKASAEALRWRIAARHGISDEDAETFLTGTDEESLVKQAERLAALAVKAPTTPRPDRTQGGTGDPPALNSDALEGALRSKLGIA